MIHLSSIEELVSIVVLTAAATDIRSRRIPNWLTLSGVAAGVVANIGLNGVAGLVTSIEGLAVGGGAYLLLYLLRAMGAGDVKLMAAVGSIVGPQHWFLIFIASSIAGGIFAVILMVSKRRTRQTLLNSAFIAEELSHFRAPFKGREDLDVKNPNALKMPHGVAIAAGTIACLALALV